MSAKKHVSHRPARSKRIWFFIFPYEEVDDEELVEDDVLVEEDVVVEVELEELVDDEELVLLLLEVLVELRND